MASETESENARKIVDEMISGADQFGRGYWNGFLHALEFALERHRDPATFEAQLEAVRAAVVDAASDLPPPMSEAERKVMEAFGYTEAEWRAHT